MVAKPDGSCVSCGQQTELPEDVEQIVIETTPQPRALRNSKEPLNSWLLIGLFSTALLSGLFGIFQVLQAFGLLGRESVFPLRSLADVGELGAGIAGIAIGFAICIACVKRMVR